MTIASTVAREVAGVEDPAERVVEAVLAAGRVLTRWTALTKDNIGYDLPGLLTGSEGTLAVITRVLLRLVFPAPATATVLVGVDDVGAALALRDAVAAVAHVTLAGISGTFNVAADDVLSTDEVGELTRGRSYVVTPRTARRLAELAWRWGQVEAPPGVVDYFMYPWIVSNAALRSTGWAPRHTTREALVETVAANSEYVTIGSLRRTRAQWRRVGAVTVAGLAAAGAVAAALRKR